MRSDEEVDASDGAAVDGSSGFGLATWLKAFFMDARSSDWRTGLIRKLLRPISLLAETSESWAAEESIMIVAPPSDASALTRRITSKPSMPGIIASSRTTGYGRP